MLVTWDDRMLDCDVYILWHFEFRSGPSSEATKRKSGTLDPQVFYPLPNCIAVQ